MARRVFEQVRRWERVRWGVVHRPNDVSSLDTYRRSVVPSTMERVAPEADGRDVASRLDALWDPGLGARPMPPVYKSFQGTRVATMHGLAMAGLRPWHWASGGGIRHLEALRRTRRDWRRHPPDVVIVPSQWTAQEAQRFLGVPAERLHVIPHGINPAVFSPAGPKANHPRPFFLHASHLQPAKNLSGLLAAYAALPQPRPDLVLVTKGQLPRKLPEGVHVQAWMPQAELATWYRAATAALFPSLAESFCLPALEAMACGCPTVVSSRAGVSEWANDAAVVLDPQEQPGWTQAIDRLATDDGWARTLGQAGHRLAQELTWETAAKAHAALLASATA